MSMLGSPVGGTNYLFVDPTSVFRKEHSPDRKERRDGNHVDEQGEQVQLRVLLPSERERNPQHSTSTTSSPTTYSLSHQPFTPSPQQQRPSLLPGFKLRRTVRLPGWQLYAIDGWLTDRARRWSCVVTRGGGGDQLANNGESRGGVLMDEYVPINGTGHDQDRQQRTRNGEDTEEEGEEEEEEEEEAWRATLDELQRAVEADGGRLEEITSDTSSTSNTTPTTTYIPHTPLPYLPHGLIPIHIPSGTYAEAREELVVNVGLRRLGCTGRSWVGLGRARCVPSASCTFVESIRRRVFA